MQNRAAKVITGASYDASSSAVLREINLDSLNVRRAKLKGVLLHKILNENSAPCLMEDLVRLRDLERYYELRNFETDLKLPKPKSNIVRRFCGIIFRAKKKATIHLAILNGF